MSESKISPNSSPLPPGVCARFGFPVDDLAVKEVTVFRDRAEVCRVIDIEATETGQTLVVVEGLSRCVNSDSLRVKGHGHCTILEVTYDECHKPVPQTPSAGALSGSNEVLQARAQEIRDEMERQRGQSALASKSLAYLETYMQTMMNPSATRADGASALPTVTEVLDAYAKAAADTNAKINAVAHTVEELSAELSTITSTLAARGQGTSSTKLTREATVVLQVTEPGSVSLELSYMVSNAVWTPSYDVRINSSDKSLALTYFGLITQNTGEDWSDTRVILSTATPSVGGAAPVLPTRLASFAPSQYQHSQHLKKQRCRRRGKKGTQNESFAPRLMNRQAMMFDDVEGAAVADEDDSEDEEPAPVAAVATSTVSQAGSSATFTIDRVATVLSDNKPHKVTVAVLDLVSAFRYFSAPTLEKAAFLQALTTNTTAYTLLASSAVNVFLDGSFISTAEIPDVSPGEKFRSFLGADQSVRVDYRNRGKKNATVGVFSKSVTTTYSFLTTVKNTKSFAVDIVVADILPRSNDARIKVRVVNPTPAVLDAGTEAEEAKNGDAAMTDSATAGSWAGAGGGAETLNTVARNKVTNNVVWKRRVEAGATMSIPFEYVIEHPTGEPITIR